MTFIILIIKPFNCGFYLQTDRGWWGGIGGKPASLSEPSFSSINEGLGPGSLLVQFSSVQSFSCVQFFATPWTAARQASLSITNSQSLLRLMSTESVMPSNHLILCCLCLLLPSIFPRIRVFSNESALHIRWPKYWNFSFSISPSNEYSGVTSFMIDWFDLLAVQKDPQKYSPKSLLKSFNSLAVNFLYGLTLTSIHGYWKNHSFD